MAWQKNIGIAAAAAALLITSACSTVDNATSDTTPSTTVSAAPASASDVAFAQGMIPHHEQAVEMADLALDPRADASAQVKQLARQIKGAQDPEIEMMTQWLQQWGAPTEMPGTTGDLAGMDHSGHDMGGMTMSGMMTAEQMQDLHQATGATFNTMWLEMMIAHHEGAIAMAEQVKASSTDPAVTRLADEIIAAQRAEITTMRQDLK
ncbi:MAG: DUF305 domain-containing protein [Actinobacteria bacterium]|nr:DUF305 domain-containing protein [Actinomycetota bacterium]